MRNVFHRVRHVDDGVALEHSSLKSSKKSSFMVPSRGLVWRQDYSSVRIDRPGS